MRFRQMLVAATMFGLPLVAATGAQAQVTGLYIGTALGGSLASTATTKNHPIGLYSQDQTSNSFGKGFVGSFSTGLGGVVNMGYGFGNGFRAEVEGFYRGNGINNITMYTGKVGQGNLSTSAGTLRNYGFMINAYYDIDPNFFPEGARFFQPYVGIGMGYGYAQFQGVAAREPNQNNNGQQQTNYLESRLGSGAGNLAYQGIIGAAFAIDSVAPGLAVTAEYRYQGMLGIPVQAKVYQVNNNNGQGSTQRLASTDTFRPTLHGSSILVGLRYSLDADNSPGAAPNLPVGWSGPAAAPVARTYMVFFANNSAALDAAGRQVVAEAVQSARTVPTTSIQLAGHADGTGRNPHNQALSSQRVQSVTAELARLGVPRSAISGGDTGAAGSTGADPQSRRVDITLR
jgi:outer membrane protein OmpA-like peptidoglycan-associated protein